MTYFYTIFTKFMTFFFKILVDFDNFHVNEFNGIHLPIE